MNRCIANPRSPKLQDSKTVSLNAESARIPQSRAVSTQPGPGTDLAGQMASRPERLHLIRRRGAEGKASKALPSAANREYGNKNQSMLGDQQKPLEDFRIQSDETA